MDNPANSITAAPTPSAKAPAEWRVLHAGDERGPWPLSELVDRAEAGELGPNDLVKQGDGPWRKASEVAELHAEFRLRAARQEMLAKVGEFRGIWISQRVLIGLLAIVLFLAIGLTIGAIVVWRHAENLPAAQAKVVEAKPKKVVQPIPVKDDAVKVIEEKP